MLEYFVTIVDEHGSGNAARTLGVSQPSVSSTLRNLESELGVELFRRTANSLVLSPEGAAVLPVARRTVLDHRRVERLVDDLRRGRSGSMTLVVTEGVAYGVMMPELVLSFIDSRPGARIDVVAITDSGAAIDFVRSGEAEAAVVLEADVPDDLMSTCFDDQAFVLTLPPTSAHLSDLADVVAAGPLRMISGPRTDGLDEVMAILQKRGIEVEVVLSGIPLSALPGLVSGGVGAAVMTESMARTVTLAGGRVLSVTPTVHARATLVYSPAYVPPLLVSFIGQLDGACRAPATSQSHS